MKKLFLFSVIAIACMAFVKQKKQKVIFFGDSITQAGVQPGGYIMRIDSMCTAAGLKES